MRSENIPGCLDGILGKVPTVVQILYPCVWSQHFAGQRSKSGHQFLNFAGKSQGQALNPEFPRVFGLKYVSQLWVKKTWSVPKSMLAMGKV